MAFGSDPAMARFRADFFEERDGQMFLRMPHIKGPPMPISYELYLEFTQSYETWNQIAKAVGFVCMMAGVVFGAYRWLVSDDLLQIFVFAGIGFVAAVVLGIVITTRGTSRMGAIYGRWIRAQARSSAARADLNRLF